MYRIWFLIFWLIPLSSLSQMKVVIEGSTSISTFSAGAAKSSTNRTDTKSLWTLNVRANIENRLTGSFFVYGGIAFDTKGSALWINQGQPDYSYKSIVINYVVLPIGLFARIPVGKQTIDFGACGFAAWAVHGFEKGVQGSVVSGSSTSIIVYNPLQIGSADRTQFHPTVVSGSDYGAETFVQIHIKKMRLGVRYSRGFRGILVNAELYDKQYYNTGVALTVAYQL